MLMKSCGKPTFYDNRKIICFSVWKSSFFSTPGCGYQSRTVKGFSRLFHITFDYYYYYCKFILSFYIEREEKRLRHEIHL